MTNVVTHISNKFFDGNESAFARFAGVKQGTVWQWKQRNTIRQSHQRRILERSSEENLGITPADFFPEIQEAG